MSKTAFLTGILSLSTALLAGEASACGESMFRIGKGVHYRAYSAPIPGTVLVYARTDEERAVAEQLRLAGHEVLVVESDVDLSMQIQREDIDVIVAPASKREAVEAGANGLTAPPDWVPVYAGTGPSSGSLDMVYPHGVDSDDEIRKYLKAIHKSIKQQKT